MTLFIIFFGSFLDFLDFFEFLLGIKKEAEVGRVEEGEQGGRRRKESSIHSIKLFLETSFCSFHPKIFPFFPNFRLIFPFLIYSRPKYFQIYHYGDPRGSPPVGHLEVEGEAGHGQGRRGRGRRRECRGEEQYYR
jgi:hypothetical protein